MQGNGSTKSGNDATGGENSLKPFYFIRQQNLKPNCSQTRQSGQPNQIQSSSSDLQESQISGSLAESLHPFAPAERFNQTMRMLMSAGDTPEMRAACPIVFGRILENFCRASSRRLGTVEKSNPPGIFLYSKFLNFSTSTSCRSMYPAYFTAISTC